MTLASLAPAALGAALTADSARVAAANFIASDDVGSRLLRGRALASIEPRGALFVARLSPSGYIVLSGDSAAEPIVAFSANDYAEPDEDSPFGALLARAATNATDEAAREASAKQPKAASLLKTAALATSASTSAAERRAAKWAKLLAGAPARAGPVSNSVARLRAASTDSSAQTVTVAPFMTTLWSQWQPYNDFVPVNRAASAANSYRQRYPCGCVATAYAQLLNYWQWPARMNATFSCDHEIYDYDNGTKENALRDTPFTVRFDAHEPFDWSQMRDTYPAGSRYTGWDLRGKTLEGVRFPVARLVMMSAVMARMYYAGGGSGANVQVAANANPWYRQTNAIVRAALGDDSFFGLVRDDLQRGNPVPVTVPGHQVVAHGWASGADSTRYVYLNYGWAGTNDGYFNVSETDTEDTAKGYIDSALVGHTPVRTAQLDPLPAVSESAVTLSWHVPERLADDFTGHTVHIRRRVDTPSAWTEGFASHETATNSASGIFVATAWGVGDGSPFLRVRPLASGAFDLMDERTLTSRSLLTYRYRADRALGLDLRVQGRFDGGEWEDVDVPPLGNLYGSNGWKTRTVFLGDRDGKTLRLRLVVSNDRSYVYGSDLWIGVLLDDFALTDVLGYEEETVTCAAEARSVTLEDLVPGASYVFSVTPQGDGAVESEAVQTSIAGTARLPLPSGADASASDLPAEVAWGEEERDATELPRILAVTPWRSSSPAAVQEGIFRECARGANAILVKCSPNVTGLSARPSHLSLVPDAAVKVVPRGNGRFVVTVDGGGVAEADDRSRMILTLVAATDGGQCAYKDVSLRFSSETAAERFTRGIMMIVR